MPDYDAATSKSRSDKLIKTHLYEFVLLLHIDNLAAVMYSSDFAAVSESENFIDPWGAVGSVAVAPTSNKNREEKKCLNKCTKYKYTTI